MTQSSMNEEASSQVSLFVDLDGTLIKTDLLFESLLKLLKQNPLFIILVPFWLFKGRAYLKQVLENRVEVAPEHLPYNVEFLSFLRQEHENGRKLILATASDRRLATGVAQHVGMFSEIIASDGINNLKGEEKLKAVQAVAQSKAFDYAGNSLSDLPLWNAAQRRLVVNVSPYLLSRIKNSVTIDQSFDLAQPTLRILPKALRFYQYSKNILLFVPIIMAHQFTDPSKLAALVLGFLSFSLCASSVYLLNDCFDLEADRTHPFKQKRPLAAGSLSISSALVLIPLLALASLWISLVLSTAFFQILLLYLILTTAYSFYFKRIALADGILLSSLYILRIIAGGVITEVLVSEWLLGFAMFFFLSLAFAKRYAELFRLSSQTSTIAKGRGYSAEDLTALAIFGIVSGYISVTILALYTNSEEMRRLYTTPEALWLICPLLLYWISRIWLLSYQGQMLEDPLVFALRDSVSYATGFLTALFLFLAK